MELVVKETIMSEYFDVRDMRIKEKFFIDDAYLNGYAKKVGWKGTLVYIALCRRINQQQTCFPSMNGMATTLGISKNTVLRGVKDLVHFNIISVNKIKTEKGSYKSNLYILLDKAQWRGSAPQALGSAPQALGVVHHRDTKDTHIKDTHRRKTTSVASLQNNPSIKKAVATKCNHSIDSEANQHAVANLVKGVAADKSVRNKVGVSVWRAKNNK